MVDKQSRSLDDVFGALADPTRRAMLAALARQPCKVGELAAPFEISLAAVSKHIQVLERAGLIRREIQGRTHLCTLAPAPLHAGAEWLRHYQRFWSERLDTLEDLLSEEDAAARSPKPVSNKQRKSPPVRRRKS